MDTAIRGSVLRPIHVNSLLSLMVREGVIRVMPYCCILCDQGIPTSVTALSASARVCGKIQALHARGDSSPFGIDRADTNCATFTETTKNHIIKATRAN